MPDGLLAELAYEEVGDILEVVFPGVKAECAVELTEQILLSFNRVRSQAAGLTILDFSNLATTTAFGPRSFALSGLDHLPADLREIVTDIITHPPVNYFLKMVSFQANSGQMIPLTYLHNPQTSVVTA